MNKITAIVLQSSTSTYSQKKQQQILQLLMEQEYVDMQHIYCLEVTSETPIIKPQTNPKVQVVQVANYATGFLQILPHANDYILILDTTKEPIYLKKSAAYAFSKTLQRNENIGLVYADYSSISSDGVTENHLLEYHIGRVRDSQDLGKVFATTKQTLQSISLEPWKFGFLYDLRLKISEKHNVRHISNRFDGSLYCIEHIIESYNVFAYLQDDRSVQQEMEQILTKHLQRINAYLPPHQYTTEEQPQFKENSMVSILIPVYRRPEFIGLAIESAINQNTTAPMEVIVIVNGGEEDPTISEVKRYQPNGDKYDQNKPPVHLLITDINNIGLSLNLGLEASKGDYYLQLDSDDRLKPNAVQKVLDTFQQNPHAAMVIGSYEVWEKTSQGKILRREDIPVVKHEEWTIENGRNNLLRINGAGAPRAYHIATLKKHGYFSQNDDPYSANYGEDYEMVLKLSENYFIARIWEPIYDVVRHQGSTDHSIDQYTIDRNNNAKDKMRQYAILRRQRRNATHNQ
ncbi:MAG TPA: glycosyltransferase family A protein [Planctomycetota bacterium]|nr:glycosyltransferase family A protein [Planctomycetota bacterium]HRU50622.1 glycosyltransferase family A protein [Planctomycetota bacterium]